MSREAKGENLLLSLSHQAHTTPLPTLPGSPLEDILEAAQTLAEAIAGEKLWLSPKEAARFLSMRDDEFRRIAPQLPRHPLPSRGSGEKPRYRYYAPELTDWLLSRY